MLDFNDYKKYDKVTLSASKINLFYECPRKYFFRYLLNWPEDEKIVQTVWPGTGFGLMIHQILEFAIIKKKEKVKDKDIIKEAESSFKPFYDKWLEDNKKDFKKSRGYTYKAFVAKGEKYSKMLTTFVLNYFTLQGNNADLLPEFKFDIEYEFVEGVTLRGIVDLIYIISDEKYELVDFKTTKDSNKFYFTDWAIDTQSLIYIYYAAKTFDKYPETFDYLVLNHELKTLFFKSFDLKTKHKNDKLFQGLTYQVEEVRDYTRKPDLVLANPERDKCYWCEYRDHCNKKYKGSLTKMLNKIRRK